MRRFDPQKSERVTLLAVLAAALFLRFFRLSHQSLWVDEILSFMAFTSASGVPYWKKLLYDVHGPLYSGFMHFWSAVSTSDFWLRTPGAIAGTLAVYALYRWFAEIGRKDLAVPGALHHDAAAPVHAHHRHHERAQHVVEAVEVGAQHAVPGVAGHARERGVGVGSRVAHHAVERALRLALARQLPRGGLPIIRGAERILEMSDAQTRVIPGHGPPSSRDDVRAFRQLLVAVRERLTRLRDAGKTVDEVVAANPLADLYEGGQSYFKIENLTRYGFLDILRSRK